MRVLVTGATGFVGGGVVRELLARGLAVRALVRAGTRGEGLAGLNVERVEGDVLDGSAVARALQGCQAVIHTAGLVTFRPDGRERLLEVNARGVEVVLGAAQATGVERAVLTSSIAVLGGTERAQVLDETSPSNAEALGIPYYVSKLRGERAALELAARGLPVVVVRPAFVLGPGDVYRTSAGIVLAIARRQLPVYVSGGLSICDVRDVAKGHVEALLRGRVGEAYLLGGHNLEVGELMASVAQLAGVPVPRRIPYPLAYAVAAGREAYDRLRGKAPRLTRDLLRSSHLYTFVSSAKAAAELGYTARPLDASLRDTLRDFIDRGKLSARTPELQAIAAARPA